MVEGSFRRRRGREGGREGFEGFAHTDVDFEDGWTCAKRVKKDIHIYIHRKIAF